MKRALFLIGLSGLLVGTVTAQVTVNRNPQAHKVAEIYNEGSISRDGRFFSYWDWDITGDLFVRDLKTSKDRRLTNNTLEGGEVGEYSVISPDNRQIVYNWIARDGMAELRLIGTDGSGAHVIYRDPSARAIIPYDWSPAGAVILTASWKKDGTYQIALISTVDGSVRALKTLHLRRDAMQSKRWLSFSPDGRYIAYHLPQHEGSPNHDIFALALDRGREVALIKHATNDRLLGWAPDGRVLFASDRRGTWDAWVMQVADGTPRGAPELVKPGMNPFQHGLGFTRDGSYYYAVSAWVNDAYLATFDRATGKIRPPKKLVSHVGFDTSVEWSPDGQYLAHVSGTGWLPDDPFVLGILAIETGKERRLQLNEIERVGDHAFQPHWSPDGRELLVSAMDRKGHQGLYRIDGQTGEVNPTVQTDPPDWWMTAVWSPDGKVIYGRRNKADRSIVARDVNTGQEKELSSIPSPTRELFLGVSPNGRQVAFAWRDSKENTSTLKVMPATGGEPRELFKLQEPQQISALAWTPDSDYIIYAISTAGDKPWTETKFELWRIAADGGEPHDLGLTMGGVRAHSLSVHPDGRRIVFTAGTPRRPEVWVLRDFLPALKTAR